MKKLALKTPFIIIPKKIKPLDIHLTKMQTEKTLHFCFLKNKTQIMYTENFRMLMKGFKEDGDPNRWRDMLCLGIGRLNIVEMSVLTRSINL